MQLGASSSHHTRMARSAPSPAAVTVAPRSAGNASGPPSPGATASRSAACSASARTTASSWPGRCMLSLTAAIKRTDLTDFLGVAGAAIGAFAGTNVDDILILAVLFTAGRPRAWEIWAGQYLGIVTLIAVSVV